MTKVRAKYNYDTGCLLFADGRLLFIRDRINLAMEKKFGRRWERDILSGKISKEQIRTLLSEDTTLSALSEDSSESQA